MFKELYSILKLQDGASEGAVQSAVQAIINENVTLKDTNQGLTGQVQNLKDEVKQLKDADKERKDADAIALVDAAIADGRFNAGQKDFLLEMFDKDFEKAKGFLGEPAKGGKVIDQIQQQKKDSVKLFDGKSWNELDKEGLLIKLKDTNIDLFKQKYKAQFGVDYQE